MIPQRLRVHIKVPPSTVTLSILNRWAYSSKSLSPGVSSSPPLAFRQGRLSWWSFLYEAEAWILVTPPILSNQGLSTSYPKCVSSSLLWRPQFLSSPLSPALHFSLLDMVWANSLVDSMEIDKLLANTTIVHLFNKTYSKSCFLLWSQKIWVPSL